jgi:hypothetical protein
MKAKRNALAEALTGMFDDHHGVLAQLKLDQIAFLGPGQRANLTPPKACERRRQHERLVAGTWQLSRDNSAAEGRGCNSQLT